MKQTKSGIKLTKAETALMDDELKNEDKFFRRQLNRLKSLVKPKKVHAEKAIRDARKYKPKRRCGK